MAGEIPDLRYFGKESTFPEEQSDWKQICQRFENRDWKEAFHELWNLQHLLRTVNFPGKQIIFYSQKFFNKANSFDV